MHTKSTDCIFSTIMPYIRLMQVRKRSICSVSAFATSILKLATLTATSSGILQCDMHVRGDVSRKTNGLNIRAMISLEILISLGTFSVWQTD